MARKAKCISNLRQIGLIMTMYADDYDGWFMPYYNGSKNWHYNTDGSYLMYGYSNATNIDPGILFCPSSGSNSALDGGYGANALHEGQGGTLMAYIPNTDYPFAKLSQVRKPSETVNIWDGTCARYIADVTNSSKFVARHNGGLNLLFVDGHVEWMTSEQVASTNGEFLKLDPN